MSTPREDRGSLRCGEVDLERRLARAGVCAGQEVRRRVGSNRARGARAQVARVPDSRPRTRERRTPGMDRLTARGGDAGGNNVRIGRDRQGGRTGPAHHTRARIRRSLGAVEIGQVVESMVGRLSGIELDPDRVGLTDGEPRDDCSVRNRRTLRIRRVVAVEVSGDPVRRISGAARRVSIGALLDRNRRFRLTGCVTLRDDESEQSRTRKKYDGRDSRSPPQGLVRRTARRLLRRVHLGGAPHSGRGASECKSHPVHSRDE